MSDLLHGAASDEPPGEAEIGQLIRSAAEALPSLENTDAFGAAFDRFAEAAWCCSARRRHGTREFYRARAAITRRLIEQHGFTIVAVEADWPDAARIDRYVRAPAPRRGAEDRVRALPDLDVAQRRGARRSSTGCAATTTGMPTQRRAASTASILYNLGASIARGARLSRQDRPARRRGSRASATAA